MWGQLIRHLSRPLPNYAHSSAAVFPPTSQSPMTSSASSAKARENFKKTICTAACLIIGDEVLGGKPFIVSIIPDWPGCLPLQTVDTNSPHFAEYCFSLGIQLKRVEVIADEESEIIEAVRRMSEKYDFVVTSGGIGPTHDDITYQSIARAFNLPLVLHEKALERMRRLSKPQQAGPNFDWDTPSDALTARLRMVHIPTDKDLPLEDQALFIDDDLWVPITVVNGNVYTLPGVPSLFRRLLAGLTDTASSPDTDIYPLVESSVAAYLTDLAARVEPKGVKVGSYPRWGKRRNTVTLVGADLEFLESLVPEVERNVEGRRVQREDEDDPEDVEEEKI
ncbi:molybdopterin binding domain-containing protein [Microsporum canis CBS 113480]|uniref:Molybdopterin binding domain-containing protein n=1 Tax=Arthroderma otae (strain ATCC MYA-4605 / CBS 113480) TaxID=554155 RepID=C5FJG8_ARTOC|nr:molybdopterin binding domain-containing protein [Microsporum canis CBS 113480]EEQ30829.1 molybdopterin binding domain-containing protein [Microsporum canis CBS 113480]